MAIGGGGGTVTFPRIRVYSLGAALAPNMPALPAGGAPHGDAGVSGALETLGAALGGPFASRGRGALGGTNIGVKPSAGAGSELPSDGGGKAAPPNDGGGSTTGGTAAGIDGGISSG